MDLSIDFECPECRTVQPQNVADLALGRQRICRQCGTSTELTGGSLEKLGRDLRELLRN